MISKQMAMVAVLGLAGVLVGQEKTQEQRVAELVKRVRPVEFRIFDGESMESARRVADSELAQWLLARQENHPLQGAGIPELGQVRRAMEDPQLAANPDMRWRTVGVVWIKLQEALRDSYLAGWKNERDVPAGGRQLLLLNRIPVPSGPELVDMPSKNLVLGERNYDRVADELLADPSDRDGLLLAHLYKLHEGDDEARVRAALFLGQLQEIPGIVVPHLLAELPGGHPRVVQEIITALGVIGPAAKAAIPALEKLADDDDAQIAERAKAAIRQVKGDR